MAFFDFDNPTTEAKIAAGIRPGMVEVGRWNEKDDNRPNFVKSLTNMCVSSAFPVVGWTAGLQWVSFGTRYNFRIFKGTKRLSFYMTFNQNEMIVVLYADASMVEIATMFIDEIEKDFFDQMARTKGAANIVGEFTDAMRRLNAETFPAWAAGRTRESKEDPLNQVLHDRYEKEYKIVLDECQEIMRNNFLALSRIRGARYVSINNSTVFVLEDIKTDGVAKRGTVATNLAEELNIFVSPIGVIGARTYSTNCLFGTDFMGTWFVDTDEPVKVSKPSITEKSANTRSILLGRGDKDEEQWLEECGATSFNYMSY